MRSKMLHCASATALAAFLVATPVGALGQENTTEDQSAEVTSSVNEQTRDAVDERRSKLMKDAVSALVQSRQAVVDLADDDPEAALEALAIATGKLDVIVAREPELALAPVEVRVLRSDIVADTATVRRMRDRIELLVDDGHLQAARPLMEAFGSEVIIETTAIPLGTYPQALKQVAAMIDDGEIDAAKTALDTAISTLVVTERVIPLPVLRAQAMLTLAERVNSGEELEGVDVQEMLDGAAREIEFAKLFGYGSDREYDALERSLERLERRLADDENGDNLFASLKRQLSALMPGDDDGQDG